MAAAYLPQAAPTTRQPKGWIPTLVVAALMIGIVAGGFIGEDAVQARPPGPVAINRAATVMPADGWDFAGRSDDGATVLLTNVNGSLAVDAFISDGAQLLCGHCDPLNRKRDEWLATGTVTASEIRDVLIGGQTVKRFDYSGTFDDVSAPVEGTVTLVSGATATAVFDGWAGIGEYKYVGPDVDEMITTAIVH